MRLVIRRSLSLNKKKERRLKAYPDSDANEPITTDSPKEDLMPLWVRRFMSEKKIKGDLN